MYALCGNRTRDLLRSSEYSHHYAKSVEKKETIILFIVSFLIIIINPLIISSTGVLLKSLHNVLKILDVSLFLKTIIPHIHTYYSRFIPEGVAEASQILLREHYLARSNTADVKGKPILV
jgi:hypothetical protein